MLWSRDCREGLTYLAAVVTTGKFISGLSKTFVLPGLPSREHSPRSLFSSPFLPSSQSLMLLSLLAFTLPLISGLALGWHIPWILCVYACVWVKEIPQYGPGATCCHTLPPCSQSLEKGRAERRGRLALYLRYFQKGAQAGKTPFPAYIGIFHLYCRWTFKTHNVFVYKHYHSIVEWLQHTTEAPTSFCLLIVDLFICIVYVPHISVLL